MGPHFGVNLWLWGRVQTSGHCWKSQLLLQTEKCSHVGGLERTENRGLNLISQAGKYISQSAFPITCVWGKACYPWMLPDQVILGLGLWGLVGPSNPGAQMRLSQRPLSPTRATELRQYNSWAVPPEATVVLLGKKGHPSLNVRTCTS